MALHQVIDQAKKANEPKDIIERNSSAPRTRMPPTSQMR